MPLPNDLPPWAVGNYAAGPSTWAATARRVVTGITAFAAAGLEPDSPTFAQSFNEWLGRLPEWVQYFRTEQGLGFYGDGNDGSATISVNTSLTRTMYYTDLTVDSAAVLTTASYPIFCTGTLTVTGAGSAIAWNGNAGQPSDGVGTGGAGGVGLTGVVMAGSSAGGAGGNTGVGGSAGAASGRTAVAGTGGTGGAGGTSGGAGATGTLIVGDYRSVPAAVRGQAFRASGALSILGGAGGGGGGGDVDGGGGGGGGGGIVLIVARQIVLASGGAIQALGGNGGDAIAGTADGGGGGGGMGGAVFLISREADESGGSVSAAGGTGGASGTGGAGTAGSTGAVIRLSA